MNDEWRYTAYSITKYNPIYRANDGVFRKDEWTSISDIGKTYNGDTLTEEEYLRVEEKYIEAIKIVMQLNKCKNISIINIEKDAEAFFLKRAINKNLREVYNMLEDNMTISLNELPCFAKLMLRELAWGIFVNKDKSLYIRFDYDYYMYFNTRIEKEILKKDIENLGLFIE